MNKNVPNVYNGSDNYIFISYAHKDSAIVFKLAKKLEERHYNFWLDTGLKYGSEWDEQLANKIKNASLVVLILSKNSICSKNCLDELNYARNKEKNIVNIIIEKGVEITEQFELRFGRYQMCKAFEFDSFDKVIDALETKCDFFKNGKKRIEANVVKENREIEESKEDSNHPYYKIDKKGFLSKYSGDEEIITIPDNVISIWSYAFNNVKRPIKKLIISKNVKEVGNLFGPIKEIVISGDNEHFTAINGVLYSKDQKRLIKFPEGKKEATFKVPNFVLAVDSYAFHKSLIQNMVLDSEDIVLEDNAFAEASIEYVDIRNSVFSIGSSCFIDCSELKTIKYYSSCSSWRHLKKGTDWYSLPKSKLLNKILTLNKKKTLTVECLDGIVDEIATEHK